MFLAAEGLKTLLPEGWKACHAAEGGLFYFNVPTMNALGFTRPPAETCRRQTRGKKRSMTP